MPVTVAENWIVPPKTTVGEVGERLIVWQLAALAEINKISTKNIMCLM
jgi:hypothetical protein